MVSSYKALVVVAVACLPAGVFAGCLADMEAWCRSHTDFFGSDFSDPGAKFRYPENPDDRVGKSSIWISSPYWVDDPGESPHVVFSKKDVRDLPAAEVSFRLAESCRISDGGTVIAYFDEQELGDFNGAWNEKYQDLRNDLGHRPSALTEYEGLFVDIVFPDMVDAHH